MLFYNFDILDILLATLAVVVTSILLVLLCIQTLQKLQLSNYRVKEYKNYAKKTKHTYFLRLLYLSILISIAIGIYLSTFYTFQNFRWIGYLFFIVLSLCYLQVNKNVNAKTPLQITARIKRLLVLLTTIILSINFCIFFLIPFEWAYIFVGVLPVTTIPLSILAMLIIYPLENTIKNRYIQKAKNKLQQRVSHSKQSKPPFQSNSKYFSSQLQSTNDNYTQTKNSLKVVGITGSYGKTTAKNILQALLQTKYKVCATQGNYNTPMGITLTINNHLTEDDEVLILELGARYRKDIQELTAIAPLDYCLITSVGDCHLETFGSLQAIVDTKCDIVDGLKENGIAIVCGDNAATQNRLKDNNKVVFINRNYDKTNHPSDIHSKNEPDNVSKNQFVSTKNIRTTTQGTSWTQTIHNQQFELSTILLGEHIPHITNLCIALAYHMGITDIQSIQQSIKKIEPVPHRLQLIQNQTNPDTIVIDDSYNANYESIKTALAILSKFNDYKKIIITPGIVEQGVTQTMTNKQVGYLIPTVCDYALLVGTNGEDIAKGIQESQTPNEQTTINQCNCLVQLFENRDKAVQHLSYIQGNKVVLFCNDLPDNFI